MKRLITLSLTLLFGLYVYGQSSRMQVQNSIKNMAVHDIPMMSYDEAPASNQLANGNRSLKFDEWTEENLGESRYDLQSNYSSQNRIFLYEDGTIAATWIMGFAETTFPERGTGYNYYDGTSWGDYPTDRIESIRCGWPSIAPWNMTGEIVVSHGTPAGAGLSVNTRPDKGTGDWTEYFFLGPDPSPDLAWPRMVTNGHDKNTVHMFYTTLPEGNGGTIYNGMDGALLYSRSLDGGTTWDILHYQHPEVTSSEYLAVGGDYYDIAEPKGDTLAFVVGSKWHDCFLLKSTDNGETWEKIMIWEHPYPVFDWSVTITDTFYCTDGGFSVVLDNSGMAHVAFGIQWVLHDTPGDTYTGWPTVDGLGYWNETMPMFSNGINTLCPYDDEPESELIENYNLIGWAQDVNGNGTWDIIGGSAETVGNYRVGASSMPELIIDEADNMYLLFSSITETFQTDEQNYRHLWMRVSRDNGDTWNDEFYDLTGDVAHIFSECVFPSMTPTTDDYLHVVYQMDTEPGGAVQGDLDPYGDNYYPYIKIHKPEILGLEDNEQFSAGYLDFASPCYPNPVTNSTYVNIHLLNPADLSIDVYDIAGKKIMEIDHGYTGVGVHQLMIDASQLPDGVYIYKVMAGGDVISHRMIVD